MLSDTLGFNPSTEPITALELALIADTQDTGLVMNILELESGHSILLQAITRIQELRSRLTDLKLAVAVDGRTISFGGPADEFPNYAHLFIHLNDISNGLDEQAVRIAENARTVAGSVGEHLKAHYKFKKFVTLTMTPPGANANKQKR